MRQHLAKTDRFSLLTFNMGPIPMPPAQLAMTGKAHLPSVLTLWAFLNFQSSRPWALLSLCDALLEARRPAAVAHFPPHIAHKTNVTTTAAWPARTPIGFVS